MRAWWAELLGTALLLVTVVGSGHMALELADGNLALALLANSLVTGLMLAVLITLFIDVSGAHFNPAVSLAMCLIGVLPRVTLLRYWSAQLPGAVLGVVLAHAMWELPLVQQAVQVRSGPGVWFAELLASFGLLFVIVAAMRKQPRQIPWLVGAYITSAYWFTASTSFANPAVTVARALTDSFTGIAPGSVPAFVLAQCVGALLGCHAARVLFQSSAPQEQRDGAPQPRN